MRILLKVGLGLLLLAMVLTGLSYSLLRAQGISAPASAAGRALRAETRPLSPAIDSVDLDGPINLTLRKGDTATLKVSGEQRLLANIETVQDGATLHIHTKGMVFHHRNPLKVDLILPALRELELRGNGDSTINGFSGDKFSLSMHGSGDVALNGRFKQLDANLYGSGNLKLNAGNSEKVTLMLLGSGDLIASGSSKSLTAQLTGSGDLDAEHLASDQINMQLLGSGDATVFARDSVDLTLHGSGDIRVYGQPAQRKLSRAGSGDIIWK